jgi:deazaflavin-dependent oxidoreductase (nitroreductase family)
MTLHVAGHAAFADLEHVGRKSGTVRHTPVRAFRAGDTVVIGLNFGRQSDWYQNIKAAGTCRMRLGGEQLTLGAPALVPAERGVKDMPWAFRFVLVHVVHTAECVRLPILHASPIPVTRRWRSHRPPSPGYAGSKKLPRCSLCSNGGVVPPSRSLDTPRRHRRASMTGYRIPAP